MTRAELRDWLQKFIDDHKNDPIRMFDGEYNFATPWFHYDGDIPAEYTEIENSDNNKYVFECEDGLMISYYTYNEDGEPVWKFDNYNVDNNLYIMPLEHFKAIIGGYMCIVRDLEEVVTRCNDKGITA